jgi:nucleoside-diphosphate-sugar epimerase
MKVLITGSDGYIGFPLVLELLRHRHKVIGIDSGFRNEWVEAVGGRRSYPDCDDRNYKKINGDASDRDVIAELLAVHKPDVIIHLASQPSMPYSQINWERALFTQLNNTAMNLNLLWGIKTNGLKCRYILTTTTGIPGQLYRTIPEEPTINAAGSWYHVSRGFDSANCGLASTQWGQQVIEFRTSIVYGIQTETMEDDGVLTRFDTDFYFGTVLNRFIRMAMNGESLTIYGKGRQLKPFISLDDTVTSIVNAIKYRFSKGHTILNQVTECVSIVDLAKMIQKKTDCKITHIPNPRKEKETFKMKFDNKKFLDVLGRKPQRIRDRIKKLVDRSQTEKLQQDDHDNYMKENFGNLNHPIVWTTSGWRNAR